MTYNKKMRLLALLVCVTMVLPVFAASADVVDMSAAMQAAEQAASGTSAASAPAAAPSTSAGQSTAPSTGSTSSAPATAPSTGTTTTTAGSASAGTGTGTVSKDGTNFRSGPSTSDPRIGQLNKGTSVTLLSIPSVIDANHWFKVQYNNQTGYIQAPYITIVTTGGMAAPGGVATDDRTYAKLTLTSANLRDKPNGSRVQVWYPEDGLFVLADANKTSSGGYDWYLVQYKNTNHNYYVRGDCIELVDAAGKPLNGSSGTASGAAPAPAPTPSTSTNSSSTITSNSTTSSTVTSGISYVKLIKTSVNLRSTPGGTRVGEWAGLGATLPLAAPTVNKNGYTWYPVNWNGSVVYARGDCVTLVSQPASTPTGSSTSGSTASSSIGYVITTMSDVNLRLQPSGTYIDRVPKGIVLPLLSNPSTSGGYTWYHVQYNNVKGYLRGDCVAQCDANGKIQTSGGSTSGGTTGGGTAAPSANGMITLTQDKVNFRSKPGGSSLGQLAKGTTLTVTGSVVTSGAYKWYPVTYNGTPGYIRSDCCTASGTTGGGTTGGGSSSPSAASTYGYIYVSKSSVNFRKTIGGAKISSLDKGTVWPMVGNTSTSGGYTWYPVSVNGSTGYVRGDCCYKLSASQEAAYLAGNKVVDDGGAGSSSSANSSAKSSYIITTVDKVNLRSSASKDANAPYNVPLGTVFKYSKTVTSGGSTWYAIVYNNTNLYVLGTCVKVMTEGEYAAYLSTNPSSTPQAEKAVGYVKTTVGGVNLRKTAGGAVIETLGKGLVLPYTTTPTTSGKYTWYYVTTTTGSKGYVRSDCVAVTDAKGNAISNGGGASSGGNTNTSDLTMAIYPAEKIDWYTGGIQTLWPKGANVKVYDVYTGIVWWAHRWSGGYHADVETLTAADTARFCKMYNVSSADEIANKNLWQRRPCLVTIGTHTYACSLYGVPHNYPEGDTISSNNMKGQVCIHFTNSKTHAGNQVDSYHTQAIQYAWEHAPNGHI